MADKSLVKRQAARIQQETSSDRATGSKTSGTATSKSKVHIRGCTIYWETLDCHVSELIRGGHVMNWSYFADGVTVIISKTNL